MKDARQHLADAKEWLDIATPDRSEEFIDPESFHSLFTSVISAIEAALDRLDEVESEIAEEVI